MRRLPVLLLVATAVADEAGRPWGAPAPPKVVRDPGAEKLRAAGTIDLGLKWLAAHQDTDEGRWDAKGFMKHDPADDRCDGSGNEAFDVGITALALLAFLDGGFTDRGDARENPYATSVKQGLRYLLASQDKEGCFGSRRHVQFMYGHAIATLAMCDAFAMTKNPRYRKPAEDGTAFILNARNPGAGWRYDPRGGESDTSVTAWCVTALRAARHCGLDVPQQAFDDAVLWVDKVTEPGFGKVGYNYAGGAVCRPEAVYKRFPAERSESMTAAGMWIRLLAGEDPGVSEAVRKGAKLCAGKPPSWNPEDGSIDMYYWHFGTLALFQVGGEEWRTWSARMKAAVVPHQHAPGSGARTGSWDPIGPWGLTDGGRIYSTALMTLCLEVEGRYQRGLGKGTGEATR